MDQRECKVANQVLRKKPNKVVTYCIHTVPYTVALYHIYSMLLFNLAVEMLMYSYSS